MIDKAKIHRLRKLEITFRFLYFLRDIGISSAHESAVKSWVDYACTVSKMAVEVDGDIL
jgi:hypothetical protein